jgi:hypothetical protein
MTNAMPLVLSGPKEKSLSNRTELTRTAVLCLCLLLAVAATAQQRGITESPGSEPSFTTFEAPGSGTGASQGTIPFSISTAGDITGTCLDASYVYHGFVRTP